MFGESISLKMQQIRKAEELVFDVYYSFLLEKSIDFTDLQTLFREKQNILIVLKPYKRPTASILIKSYQLILVCRKFVPVYKPSRLICRKNTQLKRKK
jgi:hypothetical protein